MTMHATNFDILNIKKENTIDNQIKEQDPYLIRLEQSELRKLNYLQQLYLIIEHYYSLRAYKTTIFYCYSYLQEDCNERVSEIYALCLLAQNETFQASCVLANSQSMRNKYLLSEILYKLDSDLNSAESILNEILKPYISSTFNKRYNKKNKIEEDMNNQQIALCFLLLGKIYIKMLAFQQAIRMLELSLQYDAYLVEALEELAKMTGSELKFSDIAMKINVGVKNSNEDLNLINLEKIKSINEELGLINTSFSSKISHEIYDNDNKNLNNEESHDNYVNTPSQINRNLRINDENKQINNFCINNIPDFSNNSSVLNPSFNNQASSINHFSLGTNNNDCTSHRYIDKNALSVNNFCITPHANRDNHTYLNNDIEMSKNNVSSFVNNNLNNTILNINTPQNNSKSNNLNANIVDSSMISTNKERVKEKVHELRKPRKTKFNKRHDNIDSPLKFNRVNFESESNNFKNANYLNNSNSEMFSSNNLDNPSNNFNLNKNLFANKAFDTTHSNNKAFNISSNIEAFNFKNQSGSVNVKSFSLGNEFSHPGYVNSNSHITEINDLNSNTIKTNNIKNNLFNINTQFNNYDSNNISGQEKIALFTPTNNFKLDNIRKTRSHLKNSQHNNYNANNCDNSLNKVIYYTSDITLQASKYQHFVYKNLCDINKNILNANICVFASTKVYDLLEIYYSLYTILYSYNKNHFIETLENQVSLNKKINFLSSAKIISMKALSFYFIQLFNVAYELFLKSFSKEQHYYEYIDYFVLTLVVEKQNNTIQNLVKNYKILQYESCNPQILLVKGILEETNKEIESSMKFYSKAISIDRNYSLAYLHLGTAYMYLNKTDKAKICYDQSVNNNTRFFQGYYYKTILFTKIDRQPEIFNILKTALSINEYSHFFNLILSKNYYSENLLRDAYDSIIQSEKIAIFNGCDKSNHIYYKIKSLKLEILLKLNRVEECVIILKELLKEYPNDNWLTIFYENLKMKLEGKKSL